MLLFYIRHGDPVYLPDSLTELGKSQAEALVVRMKECNPDRIFSSSSNRAIMTAEPTAKALHKEIEVLDWCNEKYAGKDFMRISEDGVRRWCFHDDTMKALFASEEVRKLDKQWYEYRHPNFEDQSFAYGVRSFKDGIERVQKETDAFMLEMGYEHDHERNGYIPVRPNEDRIALFAHQGFGLVFLSCLLDISYPQMSTRFDFSHSSITVIEFQGKDFVIPKILQLSNDSHLFAKGISTDYCNCIHF